MPDIQGFVLWIMLSPTNANYESQLYTRIKQYGGLYDSKIVFQGVWYVMSFPTTDAAAEMFKWALARGLGIKSNEVLE